MLPPDFPPADTPLTARIAAVLREPASGQRTSDLYDAGFALGKAIESGAAPDAGRPWLAVAFKEAAEGGHPVAWLDLGRCLWNGWGVVESRDQALECYVRSAELGCADAFYVVAFNLYWHFQRYKDARPWAEKALAEDPSGEAHYLYALMVYNGRGLKKDVAKSVSLHEEAARRGNADAMFELALLHAKGEGVAPDPARAARLMRQAAEKDQARACFNLGAFHATGRLPGIDLDLAASLKWYERAASLGHARAAATLGVMYRVGEGVEADEAQAEYWFGRARELGCDVPAFLEEMGL
jgi:TPR repeat protein